MLYPPLDARGSGCRVEAVGLCASGTPWRAEACGGVPLDVENGWRTFCGSGLLEAGSWGGVGVWQITAGSRRLPAGRPPPERANVDYGPALDGCHRSAPTDAHLTSTRTGMSNSRNSPSLVETRIVPWNLPGLSCSLTGKTLSSNMPVGPCRGMSTRAPGPSGGVFSMAMNGREESTRILKSCPWCL